MGSCFAFTDGTSGGSASQKWPLAQTGKLRGSCACDYDMVIAVGTILRVPVACVHLDVGVFHAFSYALVVVVGLDELIITGPRIEGVVGDRALYLGGQLLVQTMHVQLLPPMQDAAA